MKKALLINKKNYRVAFLGAVCMMALIFSSQTRAQLSGTKTVCNAGCDYATIASAVTALNAAGVGAGGVTFEVSSGHTETSSAMINLTATGTASKPITFINIGGSTNPKITGYTGSGTMDGIFVLSGSDYVTIDGIDVEENSANTTTANQMEWGYALLKKSASSTPDGCSYNVIKNCNITLKKANNGTAGLVAGCVGIYMANHIFNGTTSYAYTDTVTHSSNFNQFFSNTISNVYNGIYATGYSSTNATYDVGNRFGIIGRGNTITNFGGAATVCQAIYVTANNRVFIDGNIINGGAMCTSTLYGIYALTGTNSTIRIRNNSVTLSPVQATTTSAYSGTSYAIFNSVGSSGTNNLVEITDNKVLNCDFSNSSSSTIYGIYNTGSGYTVRMDRNQYINNTFGSTVLSCTGSHYLFYYSATNTNAGSVSSMSNNSVKNYNRVNITGGAGGTTYANYIFGGGMTFAIKADTVQNNTYWSTTGTIANMYISSSGSGLYNVSENVLTNNARIGATTGTSYLFYWGGSTTSINRCFNNTIGNLTVPTSGFTGIIYGIYFNGSTDQNYIYGNKIYDINAGGGTVYGISNTYGIANIYNNIVGNLTATYSNNNPAIRGIDVGAGTANNVYYNTVYIPSTSSTGASFGSAAFYTSTTIQTRFNNNIFINKATPGSSGKSVAHWRNGISPDKIDVNSQSNILYAGSPSATKLIYWDLTLGCQTMATYKRRLKIAEMGSMSEDVPFASTTGTDANFLHIDASTGTNVESNGYNVFGYTDDFDNTKRQGNTGYSGSGSAPDIGADEGNFSSTTSDQFPAAWYNVSAPVSCYSTSRTIVATIVDKGGVPISGATVPRCYYKKGKSGSFQSVAGTLASGTRFNGVWNFTINYSSFSSFASGDTAYAFVIAQDSATTPNISCFPAGATASSVNSVSVYPRDTFYFRNTGAGMGGTYTVGKTGANYSTIGAAVTAITTAGLCSPVVVDILPGTYREKVSVGAVAGSSRVNTIIFQSSTGNASDVIIIDSSLTSTDAYVWRFNTSIYMTLRKVTLLSKGPTYGWGLNIMGATTRNLKIKNCNIFINDSTSGSSSRIPLVVNGNSSSYSTGAKIDSLEIDSNSFKYGYFGVVFYGASTASRQDNIYFRNNNMYGAYYYGTYMLYMSGLRFANNTLKPKLNTTTMQYGLYMNYVGQYLFSSPSEITGNYITGPISYATYIATCDNSPTAKGLFANNMVVGPGSYGAFFTGSNYWNIYHNTVNMYNAATNYTQYAVYNTTLTNEIKNNILAITNTFGNTAGYAVYNTVANTPGNIDNNIYYHPLGLIPVYNGVAYSTSQFNMANSGGVGSKILKPGFLSNTDLRISFACNLTVPYISSVPLDRFGTTRSTSKPLVGAHEATAVSLDASVFAVLSPSFPITPGAQSVRVRITNNGTAPISTITVGYSVNSGSPVSQTFTLPTALAQCDTTSVLLSTGYAHTSGCITFRAWTANPNASSDQNQANDTTSVMSFGIAVNGTFTVGGSSPNFTTITAAVNSMVCGGVNGPVTFNIRPGIYREKVSVPNILGASNTNWITFQSSTGNADDVVIIDSTMSTSFVGNHYVWRFDNAKYMTLRKVSLQVKGVYGWGIHIFGANSKKIKIKGCKSFILGDSVSTSTFNIPLVVSGSITSATTGAKIDSLEIDSSYFKYGYANMIIFGTSAASRCDDIFVRNNHFYGGRSLGATYYSSLSGLRFQNNFINALYGASYGTYFATVGQYLNSAAFEFSGNKMINAIGSYGIYMSSCTNSGAIKGLFSNNMISFSASAAALYFTTCDFWDFYHNSFNQVGGAATYAVYNTSANNIIKNNIFAMNSPSASTSGYAIYSSVSVGAGNMDYNVYWNPKGTNAIYHAAAYTASTYKTAAAGGASSNYTLPTFMSGTDLRLPNVCLGTGTPFSLVPKDYYGTTRSTSAPIIGAHEAVAPTYSASAARIVLPSSSSIAVGTAYDIDVEVRNTGTTTITSLVLNYTLNGSPQNDTYTGLSIAPCGLDTLKFTGSKSATFSAGYNEVRAFTGNVNGNADGQNLDDTSAYYGFCAKLAGNYTINPSGSGATNFKTFTKAVTALYSCGVSSAVTFTVSAGTYNEQVALIGLVNGASKTNTITFNGTNPNTCKISYNTTASDPRHVIQFVGVKHFRFLNIGIENTGTTYGWGINIKTNGTQGCDSMLIKGCVVTVDQTTTSSNFAGIVISNSNTSVSSSGYNSQYSTLDSNTINGGYYGLTWFGYSNTSTYASHKNNITRNIFNNQYYYCMYLYYQDSTEIIGNRINNLGRGVNTNPYGLLTYYIDYIKVNKNRFCNMSGGYGLSINYGTGSAGRPCQIANNMISIGTAGTTNTAYGMYIYYPIYYDIVYNSVNVFGNSASTTAFYSYVSGTTYNNNRIANNNFINSGLGNAIYMQGTSTDWQASVTLMNNNNYRTAGANLFNFNGTQLNSFSTWSSTSYMGGSNDTRAKNLDPEYFSACDMHTLSLALDSTGAAVSGYTDDIDGETRSTTKTDIGADEYTPPSNNIGPIAILKPQAPAVAGYTDVWINFKNFGFNTVTSAIVKYKVGKNGSYKTKSWAGTLASLGNDTIKFIGSNQHLLTIGAKDTLYAITSSPNGTSDGYPLNDTLRLTVCGALSGTFTIGGSASSTNFATWNEATTTVSSCGISAPVIFNVAAGTYTEQVLLNTVPGATGNKTVTFRSANGNPSSVTLQYASPLVQANNYTFKFRGTKRIILRDLTLLSTGSSATTNYGTVISFDMNNAKTSDSNEVYNNTITSMNVNLTTMNYACVYSSGQFNNFNKIVKNRINNGAQGIYWDGIAPTVPNLIMPQGIVIDSNTINNAYFVGITLQYHENGTITNNLITSSSPLGTKRGIYYSYAAKGGNLSNNIIRLTDDMSFGLLVQYPSFYTTNYPSYAADNGSKKFNIVNNSTSYIGTTSASKYGVYLYYPTNVNMHHNSINMRGLGIGMYCYAYTDTAFRFVNNNFTAELGTPVSFNGLTTGYKQVDYNNYYNYNTSGMVATIMGTGYSNAASMSGAFYTTPSNSDLNSKSIDPNYSSTSDLHIKNSSLASGLNVGVAKDIENRVRYTSTPTIGAYEFAGDLRVTQLIEPTALCRSSNPTTVKLKVKNMGYTIAKNYYVNYKINGGAIQSELVTASLNPGDSVTLTHTIQSAFTTAGLNTVKAFTTYPWDVNTNDTFTGTVNVYYSPIPTFTNSDSCAGNTMTFTSTSTVVGSSIVSNSWQFGDGGTATGSTTSNLYAIAGTTYSVKLTSTSSQGCVDSATRTITVLSNLVAGTIGGNQSICYNSTPTILTSTAVASGSLAPYTYQWQSSTDNVTFSNISGSTGLTYQPGVLSSTMYYRRSARTVSGCGPSVSNTVTVTVNPVLNAGVIGSTQTVCYNGTGSAIGFTTAPSGAFGTYTYKWESSADSSSWSSISGQTGSTYTPTNVTVVTYYRAIVTSGACQSLITNGVKVKLYTPITGGTIASGQTICAGTSPAAFTHVSAPTGGPGTYTFQWQSSTDSINWNTISGATASTYASGNLSTLTYFQRLAGSTGCPSGKSNAIKVRTNYKPNVVNTVSNHCYNDPMPLTNSSTIISGTLTYLWRFGDGTTSTSKVPNKTYASSGTYNVSLTVLSNLGCKDSTVKSVLVASTPTPNFTFALKCQGDSAIFTDNTVYACGGGSGLVYTWNFGDGTTSNVQHARHHYASPGTYTVKFKLSLSGGFKDSVTKTVVFNIRSTPAFTATNDCYPAATTFTNSSSGYSSLAWSFGDGSTSATTSSSFTKTYTTAGTYNAKVVSTSTFGCKDSVIKTVSVFSKPKATFSTSNNCVGLTTSFSNSSSGAASYAWNFGDGQTSTSVNPTNTYASAGTYTVRLVVSSSNGCIDSTSKTVTIYPNSVPNFSTANVCHGFTSTFTNTSTGASNYSWNFGNGNTSTATNPTYTYPVAGNYTITLTATSSNGCTQSTSKSYTVNSAPKAAFTGNNTCLGNTITFSNTSNGASSNAWNFGDATTSTAANPTKAYASAGNYNVKLVITNGFGCKDSATNSVTIFAKPVPAFTAANQCLGTAVSFTNQSSGASSTIWVFGDGKSSASNSPTYTYSTSGTYNVKLIVTSAYGCKDSITKAITVYSRPNVSFTATPNPICRGGLMSFTNTTTNGASYMWTFGNGNTSTATSPTNIYNAHGNYNVKLVSVSSNGCKDSASSIVTVWPRPVASFKVNDGCKGDNLAFATNSVGGVGHEWTFGDGNSSTVANPSKGYANDGTYSVQLIVTSVNGCKDTTSNSVTVHPRASVSFTNATNFCLGLSTTFTNTSSLSAGTMTHQWNFGDGNISSNTSPTNTYNAGGNYTVKLTTTTDKGCINTSTSSVLVFGKPTASFNANNVCAGDIATFNNTTTGGTTYTWDFGDAGSSNLASPTHTYTNAGTYTVKLTANNSNNCNDIVTRKIIVYANPVANFTVVDRCIGQAFTFANSSTGASDVSWQFGDGNSSSSFNPTHTYKTSGLINVTLNIKSTYGCLATVTKSVSVFAAPKAAFSINDNGQCINGNDFAYTDNSTITTGSLTRAWSFGDGSNSTTTNPNKSYAGTGNFNVKLVVSSTNGCKDSVANTVMVYPKPVANFNINNASQCFNGHLFKVTDASTLSSGSIMSTWKLGDGSTASGSTAVKNFKMAGTYFIRLYVNSEFGCSDSISKSVTVNASPTVSFVVNDDIQCLNGNSFNFTNNTSGAATFSSLWNFGDGFTITTTNASRTYIAAGNYKVTLNVNTPNGCKDSAYYTMRVLSSPSAIAISGPNSAKNGSVQAYSVSATLGSTYNWVATNGSVLSNGADRAQVRWNTTGITGSLTVTETSANGCDGNPANYNVSLTPLGINHIIRNAFAANLYPNPNTGTFKIEVSIGDMVNMSIYDQLGREVISGLRFSSSIDISEHNLAFGIYTAKLTTDKGKSTVLRFEVKN